MTDLVKNVILWIVIAVVLLSVFQNFRPKNERIITVPYSTFLSYVEDGSVEEVVFEDDIISGVRLGESFVTYNPETDNTALIGTLDQNNVVIEARPPKQQSFLSQLFISSFPILLLIGVWVYFMRQMQGAGGGRGAMSFGKSRARLLGEDQVNVTFADVAAGVDVDRGQRLALIDDQVAQHRQTEGQHQRQQQGRIDPQERAVGQRATHGDHASLTNR